MASKQEAYRDRGAKLAARISKDMEMSANSVLKAQGTEYHDEDSREDAMLEILLDLELGFLEGMRSYLTTLDMSMDEAGIGMGEYDWEDDEDAADEMYDDEAVIANNDAIEAEQVAFDHDSVLKPEEDEDRYFSKEVKVDPEGDEDRYFPKEVNF